MRLHTPVEQDSVKSNEGGENAFTLVELLISLSLSLLLLAAILSSSVFYTKAGLAMAEYAEMAQENNVVTQLFSQDVRSATAVQFTDENSLRLTVNSEEITYVYTNSKLTRTASGSSRVIASGLTAFEFRVYSYLGGTLPLNGNLVNVNASAKMIQLYLLFERNQAAGFDSSQVVETPRYMLRNRDTSSGA